MNASPIPLRLALLAVFAIAGPAEPAPGALRPFTLPWDDATPSVTNLSPWSTVPAGVDGWLGIDAAGHFSAGGGRVRILGVNIGASAAFPDKSMADAVAARMAKFGINAVRFHHMEAPWDARRVLIDYETNASGTPIGRSRQLSADRLDRLHWFVSRLKAHGIYSNINLLVSRQFFPNDGLPAEIAQLDWKSQHHLAFFDDDLRALHREHATSLLTAPNPYTGIPLAQDPAVAFVEIMNENGIMQAWHDGLLDSDPAVFRNKLLARWNSWLGARYASTAAMLAAWGAVNEPPGPNVLRNGAFAAGTADWNRETHSGAQATFSVTNEFTGAAPSMRIAVTTAGSAGWHVQLNQAGHSLVAGQIYTVSFWARASAARPLTADITRAGPSDYSAVQSIWSGNLGATWQRYSASFIAGGSEPSARLNFSGMGTTTGTVWIAEVNWSTGGQAGTLPDGVSLEAANVPGVRRTGGTATLPRQKGDWVTCLLDLERRYWLAMREHVKTALGYRGLVFGTIASNSPPGIQAELDVVDTHSYWQHPEFPGASWDPVNWRITNTSMVNDNGGSLAGLAVQRVHGKPHMVTEYQHASPATFGAEGPLLLAAYGALQDWDGLWMFDYGTGPADWARGYVSGFFAQDTHPAKMANMLLAAAMFRRGDVATARHEFTTRFDDATQIDVVANSGGAWAVGDGRHLGVPGALGLVSRLSLSTGVNAWGATTPPVAPSGPVFASDTGELTWDRTDAARGLVTVNTPRTKLVAGFASGRSINLDGFVFSGGATGSGWFTAGLTMIEGEALRHAGGCRALLVAAANVENTGQVWTDATKTSVGANWGRAPVLVEVVPLSLTLPVAPEQVSAWALDGRGARAQSLAVAADGGGARLSFGNSGDTLWYEIVIAPGAATAPVITRNLMGRTVAPGTAARLEVEAEAWPVAHYSWTRDGVAVGADAPFLEIANAGAGDAGVYKVVASNAAGSVASREARLAVRGAGEAPAQFANISTRGPVLIGERVLIPGFVIVGSGRRQVLVRAVGPKLRDYGLPAAAADTRVDLLSGSTVIASNDDWSAAAIGDAFARVHAFDFAAGSRDAALLVWLDPGSYTAHVHSSDGTGLALAEVYDAGGEPGSTARLTNISTRGQVSGGDEILIAGIVVAGPAPKQVLVRAIGPTLARFGVGDVLRDPELHLVQPAVNGHPTVHIASNDNWWSEAGGTALAQAAAATYAFPLEAGSRDAALLAWLEPGNYTAIVNGVRGDTGVALVEVYEMP